MANGDRPRRSTCFRDLGVPERRPVWRARRPGAATSRYPRRPGAGDAVQQIGPLGQWPAGPAAPGQLSDVAAGELAQELPNVAGAYTPPNSRFIPPARIRSRSSMQSAPAAIPAMIEVSFPAGFTPAEATLES